MIVEPEAELGHFCAGLIASLPTEGHPQSGEFEYRFNHRDQTDADRFENLLSQTQGRLRWNFRRQLAERARPSLRRTITNSGKLDYPCAPM